MPPLPTDPPAAPPSLALSGAERAHLEAGVVQRAHLLSMMLTDAYGPQRLFHDGLLAPALLFRAPGYLRALDGGLPPGSQRLQVASFDVARGADGHWWMSGQHLALPVGLDCLLADAQAAAALRRWVVGLREQVSPIAAQQGDAGAARLVLLSPRWRSGIEGAADALAQALGLPRLADVDLQVAGGRLWERTAHGPVPVHGLLRQVDDADLEPLEFGGSDTTHGIAGLAQVLRAGQLLLVNSAGAGWLESTALHGFMPAMARAWLNAPLALPALPCWWCGEASAWRAVRSQLAGRRVRPAFDSAAAALDVGPADVAALQATIEADPDAWTVEQRPDSMPFDSLRIVALADAQGDWSVLPGGLARNAAGLHWRPFGSSA